MCRADREVDLIGTGRRDLGKRCPKRGLKDRFIRSLAGNETAINKKMRFESGHAFFSN